MKIKIEHIEKVTGYKVKKGHISLGIDIAERTGFAEIKTNDKEADITFWFGEFKDTEITNVYKNMYSYLQSVIEAQTIVVIEDSYLQYYGRKAQADVFKKLTRFGTLALATCFNKELNYKFILAKSARAKLKILTSSKAGYGKGESKKAVADWLKNNLDIELNDNDASDAVVLSILGILEGLDFRSEADIKRNKK